MRNSGLGTFSQTCAVMHYTETNDTKAPDSASNDKGFIDAEDTWYVVHIKDK